MARRAPEYRTQTPKLSVMHTQEHPMLHGRPPTAARLRHTKVETPKSTLVWRLFRDCVIWFTWFVNRKLRQLMGLRPC